MSPCVPSGAALFLIEIHDQDISRNSCVMVDRMEVQMHVRRGRLVLLVIFAVSISVCRANAQKRAYEKLPAEPEVQGIEGVFIYSNNPDSLAAWYRNYLGIESVKRGQIHSQSFICRSAGHDDVFSRTTWAILPAGKNTSQNERKVMISYRIRHLDELLTKLKSAGVLIDKTGEYQNVKFVRLTDPEGNPVELSEDLNQYDDFKE